MVRLFLLSDSSDIIKHINMVSLYRAKKIVVPFFIMNFFAFSFLPLHLFASETVGTISPTSNNTAQFVDPVKGYVHFGLTQGAVTITDTALTGYAWSEKYGWIRLNPSTSGVTNDAEGDLSGYAWGERTGWVNFNATNANVRVTISDSGVFSGYAWAQNVGWLNMAGIITDWRPASVRNASSGSGGSSPSPSPSPSVSPSPSTTPSPSVSPTPNPPPPDPTPSNEPPPPPDPSPSPSTSPSSSPSNEPPGGGDNPPGSPPDSSGEPNDSAGGGNGIPSIPDVVNAVTDAIGNVVTNTVDVFVNVVTAVPGVQATQKAIQQAYEEPVVNVTSKVVTTGGIVVSGTVAASSLLLTSLSLFDFILIPLRLWSLLLGFFGFRKRHRPWGTAYDSVTKQPLDPVFVVLKDAAGKQVSTSITDFDGRYGFLPNPGTYSIGASKTHYTFPSIKLAGKTSDELYDNLYYGGPLTITEKDAVISQNIPMDPEGFDWNEFEKSQKQLMVFYSKRDKILVRISDWFFRIGLVVSIISLFAAPEPYNYIIGGFYVVMLIVRKFGSGSRKYGSLTEKMSGVPLSFAIIRVILPTVNVEVTHKVADKLGRYFCLVAPGTYYIKIDKKMPDESYQTIHTSAPFEVKKGIINDHFKL